MDELILRKYEVIEKCLPIWKKYIQSSEAWAKYFNEFDYHFKRAIRNYELFGLGKHAPMRILDLGTGAGYFPYLCKHHHSIMTCDVGNVPFYTEVTTALGLLQYHRRITPYTPLAFPKEFEVELITAFHVNFDFGKHPTYPLPLEKAWQVGEWTYFIEDIKRSLVPNGILYLELLKKVDNIVFPPGVKELFIERYKAEIKKNVVLIRV